MRLLSLCCVLGLIMAAAFSSTLAAADKGSSDNPLKVMLIPADGGTEDGTKADFEPIFNAISNSHDLHFEIRVGQSYAAVIEAMSRGQMDIAFFGPLSYLQARERGGAQLLAVAVQGGASVYYSGLFKRADSGIDEVADVKGKAVALGDVNSTSSFAYPVALLVQGGVDPIQDLSRVVIAGSHANSLAALAEGQVDVCGASFDSYEKAVNQGAIDPEVVVPLKRSNAIPAPPLAMHPDLSDEIKDKLLDAFAKVHEDPSIKPEMIRGYGGKVVERYDTTVSEDLFTATGESMQLVDDELKAALVRKASEGK